MELPINRIGDVTIERVTSEPKNALEPMNYTTDSDSDNQISDEELNPEPSISQTDILDPQLDTHKRKNEFETDQDSKKTKIEEIRTNLTDNEDSEYDSEEDSDLDEPGSKPGTPKGLIEAENTDFIEKLTNELGESSQKEESKIDSLEYEYDIAEKLKEMGEISVETVKKGEKPRKTDSDETENEISVTPAKKECDSDSDDKLSSEKKIGNMRRNIREVMDETQLDEATLAAQRQEMERLRRVQEQQRIIREVQRQIALNRQNNKTQHRVISLLQGNSLIKNLPSSSKDALPSGSGGPTSSGAHPGSKLGSTVLVKLPNGETKSMTRITKSSTPFEVVKLQKGALQGKMQRNLIPIKKTSGHLTPSVSIAPVSKKIEPKIESDSESDLSDSDKKIRKVAGKTKDVVTISSSSDDDCIVLSEEEDEPEPDEDPCNSGMHTNDAYNVPDEQGRVLINVGHPENESAIFLAPQIARVIKPHQIGGVRFLFDNVIESTDRFSTSTGFGCILAHSMGLGKTLQIVCFSDIFLRHTGAKTILCIMPINTLQNWMAEFNMWLPKDPESSPLLSHGEVRPRNFNLFVLNDSHKTLAARAKVIKEWTKDGGVLLIGYELYRLLSLRRNPKSKSKKRGTKNSESQEPEDEEKNKSLFEEIHEALVKPGPDLVICDEGHRIKNSHASISQALKQIRSKRRIVLTGYPLQNNLLEYWCMVDFVRPNYLGTKTEFSNMFERPIQNGQCIDSTPQDIRLMRYRAHVLHSLLEGFVQRRSHAVLQTSLPQKEEYVLLVRMTEFQRKLYDTFMNEVVRTKTVPNPLKAFAVCCKIWNHPDVLYYFLKKQTAGDAVDIDLEEVAGNAQITKQETPKKGSSRSKGAKKEKKSATSKTQNKEKPAASVTPNTNTTTTISNTTSSTPAPQNTAPTAPPAFPTPSQNPAPPPANNLTPQNYQNYPQNYQYPQNFNQYSQNGEFYQNQNYGQNYQNNYNQNWNQSGEYSSFYPENKEGYANSYNNDQSYWQNNQQNQYFQNGQPNDYYQNYPQNYQNYQQNYPQNYQYGPNNPYPQNQGWQPPANDFKTDQKDFPPNSEFGENKTDVKLELDAKDDKIDERKEEERKDKEEEDGGEVDIKNAEMTAAALSKKEDPGIPYDWAHELMKGYIPGCIENSAKMQIFFCILQESMALGDRILLFSQSLFTLNLIEEFLQKTEVPGAEDKWAKNKHYYRLDGSTSALEREKLINEYNSNPNIHLFLVSTRAGSLGINLVGANRVIVFDASWNPCHDTQAVCRVYRYGQKKPCFVYRIVMDNCLEKKIYDRQINKQGMADRVVDECNPDAHLSMKDVTNLCWDDEQDSEVKDFSTNKDKYIDVVMQKVLDAFSHRLSKEPFQHESLLIDRKEKKLSQAEKRLAKRSYELEKQANINSRPTYSYYNSGSGQGLQIRAIRSADGSVLQNKPVASVRPMQSESLVRDLSRPGGPSASGRSRWIPAEVWQRQGMTAQEMTLPLDVVIPTNSPDRGSIVLKAGQKVLVLKSPKGIYMQLECGKIVAIKTAFKVRGGKAPDKNDDSSKEGSAPTTILKKMPQGTSKSGTVPLPLKNNTAITVIPKGQQRVVKPFTQGVTKLNMKSIRQPVPNLIGRQVPVRVGGPRFTGKIQSIHRKVQLAKAKPYNMDKVDMSKIKTEPPEIEPEPQILVPSSDEENPETQEKSTESSALEPLDPENEKNIQNLEIQQQGSEKALEKLPEAQSFTPPANFYPQSFESFQKPDAKAPFLQNTPMPISTPIIQESSANRSLKAYRHNFAGQKASKAIKSTSSALHQLEQTTSLIGEAKQAFQESLDHITNSYTEKDQNIQNLDEKIGENCENPNNSLQKPLPKIDQIQNIPPPSNSVPPVGVPPLSGPPPLVPPLSGPPPLAVPISGPPQANTAPNQNIPQQDFAPNVGGAYSGYYGYGGPPYPPPPQNYYPAPEMAPKNGEKSPVTTNQNTSSTPQPEITPPAPQGPPPPPPAPAVGPTTAPAGPQNVQNTPQNTQNTNTTPNQNTTPSSAPVASTPAQGPAGYAAPPGGFGPYGPPPPHAGYDVYGQQNQYGNYPGMPYPPNQPNYQPYQNYDQSYSSPNMYSAFHRPEVHQYPNGPPVGSDPYQYRNYPPQYGYGPPAGSAPQYGAPTGPGYEYQYPPPPFPGPYVPNNNPTP